MQFSLAIRNQADPGARPGILRSAQVSDSVAPQLYIYVSICRTSAAATAAVVALPTLANVSSRGREYNSDGSFARNGEH